MKNLRLKENATDVADNDPSKKKNRDANIAKFALMVNAIETLSQKAN